MVEIGDYPKFMIRGYTDDKPRSWISNIKNLYEVTLEGPWGLIPLCFSENGPFENGDSVGIYGEGPRFFFKDYMKFFTEKDNIWEWKYDI